MKTHHRPFINESADFKDMCALLVREGAVKKGCFVWHIARLVDWKYNLFNPKRRIPGNFAQAAHLWFDESDRLVGFVISEEFDEEFTLIAEASYETLFDEMLAWVDAEWGTQYDELITCVVASHTMVTAALERAGYVKTDDMEVTRTFDTSLYKDTPHPAAPLRFESMAQNGNYENQRILRASGWSHPDLDLETERALREHLRTSPIYDARFDFVLVGENGAHLSGCEAFIDRENGTAEIERVCTHADHENKGYAKMVIYACLRALHENCIPTAYISGTYGKTISLYGKLGHVEESIRRYYTKSKQ